MARELVLRHGSLIRGKTFEAKVDALRRGRAQWEDDLRADIGPRSEAEAAKAAFDDAIAGGLREAELLGKSYERALNDLRVDFILCRDLGIDPL